MYPKLPTHATPFRNVGLNSYGSIPFSLNRANARADLFYKPEDYAASVICNNHNRKPNWPPYAAASPAGLPLGIPTGRSASPSNSTWKSRCGHEADRENQKTTVPDTFSIDP